MSARFLKQYKLSVTVGLVAGVCLCWSGRANAAPETALPETVTVTAQTAGEPAPPLPQAILQVSGTSNRVTISANRADVRSVLKLLFQQGGRQFVPDSTVSGEVTLVLSGQTFETALRAVCEQTFLRWGIEPATNIYRVTQDINAVRNAIARINATNGLIRRQLQTLGYQIPDDAARRPTFGERAIGGSPAAPSANGFGGGATLKRAERPADTATRHMNVPQPVQNLQEGSKLSDNSGLREDEQRASENMRSRGRDTDASLTLQFDATLRQNNLVTMRVAQTRPTPVADVLTDLARQAGVSLLLDPAIPSGPQFRVWGSLTRPLPDALNLLTTTARLEWRYVLGGKILVTPSPQFQLFYGGSPLPRASFGLQNGTLTVPGSRPATPPGRGKD